MMLSQDCSLFNISFIQLQFSLVVVVDIRLTDVSSLRTRNSKSSSPWNNPRCHAHNMLRGVPIQLIIINVINLRCRLRFWSVPKAGRLRRHRGYGDKGKLGI